MRTQTSADSREAAAALDGLLQTFCGIEVRGENYFDRDWLELWQTLVRDDWTAMGTALAQDGQPEGVLVDLCAIAEVWGRYLVPLPLIEMLYQSFVGVPTPSPALEIGNGTGTALVPRTDRVDLLGSGPALTDVDAFAPSLVLGQRPSTAAVPDTSLLVLLGAEALGSARAAFESAVEYSKVRHTYGSPIGSYQAIKHRLADDHKDLELAHSGLVWAAHEPDAAPAVIGDVIERAATVITDAIQVHGGIGFTWELGLHFHLRHVMAAQKALRWVETSRLPA